MNIRIPDEAEYIINTLADNGYAAYVVGGCVRDSLLGCVPKDWDICTSAPPGQLIKCFCNHRIIETGIQHGTVTIVINNNPFELTTYRVDGEYTDNRHPDRVEFVNSIKEDLSRRDFTINAMAYSPKRGIVDFFSGMEDLRDGIIRCVGEADKRFREDALRIMRALRFAGVLGFAIDSKTSVAMLENRKLLKKVAAERIAAELNKLIAGSYAGGVLLKHKSVITEIIPELICSSGFEGHCHMLSSADNTTLRFAVLFHDIGGDDSELSANMSRAILKRLKYDNDTINTVAQLVLYHGADIQPKGENIKRWLNKKGLEGFYQLIDFQKADAIIHSNTRRVEELNGIRALTNEIVGRGQCYSLKDLAVNGKDLIAIGVSEGEGIGFILGKLLDMVIDGSVENDRDELMIIAKELKG